MTITYGFFTWHRFRFFNILSVLYKILSEAFCYRQHFMPYFIHSPSMCLLDHYELAQRGLWNIEQQTYTMWKVVSTSILVYKKINIPSQCRTNRTGVKIQVPKIKVLETHIADSIHRVLGLSSVAMALLLEYIHSWTDSAAIRLLCQDVCYDLLLTVFLPGALKGMKKLILKQQHFF